MSFMSGLGVGKNSTDIEGIIGADIGMEIVHRFLRYYGIGIFIIFVSSRWFISLGVRFLFQCSDGFLQR